MAAVVLRPTAAMMTMMKATVLIMTMMGGAAGDAAGDDADDTAGGTATDAAGGAAEAARGIAARGRGAAESRPLRSKGLAQGSFCDVRALLQTITLLTLY